MFLRTESFKDFLSFYPVTACIVGLQIGIWLINWIIPPLGQMIIDFGIGFHYAISMGEYWRFVTPIFLHGGVGHILFNSFALVIFAPALEQMLGKGKFIFTYFFAGIVANILTFVVEPSLGYTHLGASGAIYGLLGLYLFMVFFEKRLIDPNNARLILIVSILGLIMTFIRANINVEAHIFGFIAGFALGPIILKNVQPFSPWKNTRRVSHGNDDIGFDPNRWNKKRYKWKPYLKPIITAILIILVLLGLLYSIL